MNKQNNLESVIDRTERGEITTAQANVMLVRNERYRIITRLPREVRVTLNAAVKRCELGRMKKDGILPEVYYHPNFKHLAIEARRRILNQSIAALQKVCK